MSEEFYKNYEMKRKEIILTVIIILLVMTSCLQGLLCVSGNGVLAEEYRTPGDFTGIANSTSIDVIFRKADTNGIIIEAEENLLYYIVTETNGNTLSIRIREHTTCLNFTKKPLITVTGPGISDGISTGSGNMFLQELSGDDAAITLTGSGDISIEKINFQDIAIVLSGSGNINSDLTSGQYANLRITGSGNISIKGEGTSMDVIVTGSGSVYASGYTVASSEITITGSGNVYTTVLNLLTAIISGSGNIYLRGDPELHKNITGSGRIIYYKK